MDKSLSYKLIIGVLLLFNIISPNTRVHAASFDQAKVKALKEAVVFIRNGAMSGSGFLSRLQGENGVIVTNQHVVDSIPNNGFVDLFFNSGAPNQRHMRGVLLAAIPELDLALIKIKAQNLPEPISLKPRPPVYETESIFALGFPFGSQLATNRETPRITITAGSVTSLRSDLNDQTMFIQTDAAINPGNSGGPVVDQEGHLVGVTVAKLGNTNISFVIPRRRLEKFLEGQLYNIDLSVERKWLDSERWLYSVSSQSNVHSVGIGRVEAGLDIILADRKAVLQAIQPDQSWMGINGKNKFTLKYKKQTNSGNLSGTLEIPSHWAGSKLAVQPYLKLKKGVSYQAPLWLELELTGRSSYVFEGPNRAMEERKKSTTRPGSPSERQKKNSKKDKGQPYAGGEESSKRSSKRAGKSSRADVVMLPGSIDSLALAGGGRYLVFGVDAEKSVVLFDFKKRELLPLDIYLDEPTLVAGDLEHVYVAGTDSGQLIKWSLAENKETQKGFSSDGAAISAIAVGWNSKNDTLFLITTENFEMLDTKEFNVRNMRWMSAQYSRERKPHMGHNGSYRARASGNGKIFTFWGTEHSPAGVNVLSLRGGSLFHYRDHATAGFVVPDRRGKRIYTGMKGVYSNKLDQLELDYLKGGHLIPGIRGDHILKVSYKKKVRAALHRSSDGKIVGVMNIPERKADAHPYSYHRKRPTGDQCFWLDEDNNQLVVIPESNDRIVIHKLPVNLASE